MKVPSSSCYGSLCLERMEQEQFDHYVTKALPHLATEIANARGTSLEDGWKAANASFESLVPGALEDSPDQHIFAITDRARIIGTLWFGIIRDKGAPYAYVWDVVLDETHRGKGLGKLVMKLLEDRVMNMGIEKICLNVFTRNSVALRLYERLGYQATSQIMQKVLS